MRAATAALRRVRPDDVGILFYAGPTGRLRVSHRQLDQQRSTPTEPHLTHTGARPVEPGHVVGVDIGLWPAGMRWRVGDTMRLTVSGTDPRPVPLRDLARPTTVNSGEHLIHTGGQYPSALIAPLRT